MSNIVLVSSFQTVMARLQEERVIPESARVAFFPTAGRPYAETPWLDAERRVLVELGYDVYDVDLVGQTAESLAEALHRADIIFMGGGNVSYLFEHVHRSGFDRIIRDLLAQGKMYIGSSAGAILAGPSAIPFVDEDKLELPSDFTLADPAGLSLVDFIVLPHYPSHAKSNDRLTAQYADQFTFKKMRDDEWWAGETQGL